jgi:hypothetical protein
MGYITVVGIKLFLRVDEVLDMTYEDFLAKYFVAKSSHVDSLRVKIQGKRDSSLVKFAVRVGQTNCC